MRCSVQRSDRATMDRRSSHVPCSTPPRVPSSASCSLAHGWATGQATVRTIGVARVPSASLGGAAPPSKTARRPPCVCRAVRRQLCRALMPLAWSLLAFASDDLEAVKSTAEGAWRNARWSRSRVHAVTERPCNDSAWGACRALRRRLWRALTLGFEFCNLVILKRIYDRATTIQVRARAHRAPPCRAASASGPASCCTHLSLTHPPLIPHERRPHCRTTWHIGPTRNRTSAAARALWRSGRRRPVEQCELARLRRPKRTPRSSRPHHHLLHAGVG